jgi:hypothetical protein
MIQESGAYTFIGKGMTDVVLGAGMFRLEDGRLVSDTEGRRLNFSLYNRMVKLPWQVTHGIRKATSIM